MLAKESVSSEKLTVLYEYVVAELATVSVSLRQASPATSFRVAMDTVNGWCGRRIEALLNHVRVLRELVQTLDARVTVLEAPARHQPTSVYVPTQGTAGIAPPTSTVEISGLST